MAKSLLGPELIHKIATLKNTRICIHETNSLYVVTYRPTTRQGLGKHIPSEVYASNNRTSIARQRINKQAFSTIERQCFLRSQCRGAVDGRRRSSE
jgi:hypothetical protein